MVDIGHIIEEERAFHQTADHSVGGVYFSYSTASVSSPHFLSTPTPQEPGAMNGPCCGFIAMGGLDGLALTAPPLLLDSVSFGL